MIYSLPMTPTNGGGQFRSTRPAVGRRTQPISGLLYRLLFSGLLLLTMINASAQTTWTSRYQGQGGALVDVAYDGTGRYVSVGHDGLIRVSTDGIVWTTQVPGGSANNSLHAIVYAAGKFVTVGYSGRVLTSTDGLTWVAQASGTANALMGIAYGGGRFIAVGDGGIAITSTDGATWTTLTTGTSLNLLAITYGSNQFVVVGQDGLIRTTPNGIIFTARTSNTVANLRGVTVGSGGSFVAVGANSAIVTSTNGISWVLRSVAGPAIFFTSVAYHPATGQYVAVSTNANHLLATSADGITWTAGSSGTSLNLYGVRHVDGLFIAVGDFGMIRNSLAGLGWTSLTITSDMELRGVAHGNSRYVAVGSYPNDPANPAKGRTSVALTSGDGMSFVLGKTDVINGFQGSLNDVAFGNGLFATVGLNSDVQTSVDGKVWSSHFAHVGKTLYGIAYGGGRFVAVGNTGFFVRSTDGITWTENSTGSDTYRGITYGNGQFVTAGEGGVIGTSPNGAAWTARTSNTANQLTSVAYGNGAYVAVGIGGTVARSVNSTTWSIVPSFTSNDINHVTFGNGQFVAVAFGGHIYTSPDGTVWTERDASTDGFSLNGITHGNGLFVAVGQGALVMTSPNDGGPPPVNPGSFAITGVTLVSCTAISAGQRQLIFSPQYSGLSGQPISFSVTNEMLPTTNAGPYTLNMYIDNPVITLKATQSGTAGEASFGYSWLSVCNGGVPPVNQPPVAPVIPSTTGMVGQVYSLLIPPFTDPEGLPLTYSVTGLPPGLLVGAGGNISGPPTLAGVYVITVTATDPGGLSASATYTLTISPAGGNPGAFAITGVILVSCHPISPTQRQLIFSPQYSGLSGQPISFSVTNEMMPTTNAGPYTLNMYTDNPVIMLKATQSGTAGEASFVYNWFVACGLNNARLGVSELAEGGLAVQVLGNPVENGVLSIEVRGAAGQSLSLIVSDMRGQVVGRHGVGQAGSVEEHRFGLGHQPAGLYLLRVSTASQTRTVKVMKR